MIDANTAQMGSPESDVSPFARLWIPTSNDISSHLGDCDVPLLNETDFQPNEPGSLPSAEHVKLFIHLCQLCLIISGWLDGRRPSAKMATNAASPLLELEAWYQQLPLVMQDPSSANNTTFTLWTGTLHIVYHAFIFRLATSLAPDLAVARMHSAAVKISSICKDLDNQDLLGSLWNFAIHEFDLAMGQHARETNASATDIAASGLKHLQEGLPMMRKLGRRSSVARQGLLFYEELAKKRSSDLEQNRQGQEARCDSSSTLIRTGPIAMLANSVNVDDIYWDPQLLQEALPVVNPYFAVDLESWSWEHRYDDFDLGGQDILR